VIAVLQGWSKNTLPGRMIALLFVFGMALAARWGAHVLGLIR